MLRSIWLILIMVSMAAAWRRGSKASPTKRVESFQVKSDIRFRFATTEVSSRIRNLDNKTQEVSFDVTMPDQAFMVAFFMIIDGERYDGQVRKRQTALGGNQAVQTPQQTPRNANIFAISVNVTAGSAATFTLTYQEMLLRSRGFYEYEIYINPGQVVPDLLVDVQIQENRPFRFVRTPAMRNDDLLTSRFDKHSKMKMNTMASVNRTTTTTATVLYMPSKKQQKEGISARFVVQYDFEHGKQGENLLVADHHFVQFINCEFPTPRLPKDTIFVLDRSGSMIGDKIRQVKDAMGIILSDMSPRDRFNIIAFSASATRWNTDLVQAEENRINEAKSFVDKMSAAGGGTNMQHALLTALLDLTWKGDKERPSVIFFLTDGKATVGKKDPSEIAKDVFNANDGTVAIYCLAFGRGADMNLLKTLSAQNLGFARRIYEASDAALQVSSVFEDISSISGRSLHTRYAGNAVDVTTLTQTEFPIVYNATEISVHGLLMEDAPRVRYEITESRRSGELKIFAGNKDIETLALPAEEKTSPLFIENQDRPGIIERMWAFQTITAKLAEKDKYPAKSKKTEKLLHDVFVKSLTYNFVTPLTSMVVDTPGQGLAEFRQANMEDEIFDYTVFNFTAPLTPTTVMTTTQTTSDPNGSRAVDVHLHTCIIISIITLLLLFI